MLSTGAAVSISMKDKVPMIASIVISSVFVAGYEYQIANPSTDHGKETNGSPWMRALKKKS